MAFIAAGTTVTATSQTTGSWTPTATGNGFSSATGRYFKIGKLVYVVGRWVIPTGHTGSSGSGIGALSTSQFKISGLPFTAANQSGVGTEGNLICSQWSIGSQNISWMGGEVQNGFNFIYMHYHNGGNINTNNLTPSNSNNQLHFRGTCVYRAAS